MRTERRALWTVGVCLVLGLVAAGVFLGGEIVPQKNGNNAERARPMSVGTSELTDSPPLAAAPSDDVDCNAPAARQAAGVGLFRSTSVVRRFFAQHDAPSHPSLYRPIVADLAGAVPFAEKDPPSLAGIPLRLARIDRLVPPLLRPRLDYVRQRSLEAALGAPTLDGFLAAAKDDPDALRQGWYHFDPKVFLRKDSALAHALRTRGGELLPRIQEIPAAAFGLHELAVAIAQGIDAEDFAALLNASGADATGTWKHHTLARRYNLAAFAAVHARPRILRDLLARGVALTDGMPSVLDELALALADTRPAPDALADVTGQLVALGELPFLPSTAERLTAVVPGIAVPGLHPKAEAVLALPGVRENAEQLAVLVRRAKAQANEAQRITERCRDAWLAGTADGAGGLASKLAQHEAMRERERRSMQENMEQVRGMATGLSAELLEVGGVLGQALAAGNWQEVLDMLDSLLDVAPKEIADSVPTTLLRIALDSSDASMDVVRELIRRNDGVLPADIILTLLASNRDDALQVAAELEAWGLDPGFVDADGRNAVNHVIDAFRDRRDANAGMGRTLGWLNYLANRSVSPQPAGRGLDPLDTVLFAALDDPTSATVTDAVLLARVLIGAGASVRPSHREIAARISAAAPDAYAKLVRAIPELGA